MVDLLGAHPALASRNGSASWSSLWSLSTEGREVVERVAVLARERFARRAARHDAEASFPAENYRDLREAGLLGLTVPREYGGLGLDRDLAGSAARTVASGLAGRAGDAAGERPLLGDDRQDRVWPRGGHARVPVRGDRRWHTAARHACRID